MYEGLPTPGLPPRLQAFVDKFRGSNEYTGVSMGTSTPFDYSEYTKYVPEGLLPGSGMNINNVRGERQSAGEKWLKFAPNLVWNTAMMTAEMPLNGLLYMMGNREGIELPRNIAGDIYQKNDAGAFNPGDLADWLQGADSLVSSMAAFAVPARGLAIAFGKMAQTFAPIKAMQAAELAAQGMTAASLAALEGTQVANQYVRQAKTRVFEKYMNQGYNLIDAERMAKVELDDNADRIVALNTIMNTALNVTMLSPFFRSAKMMGRQAAIDEIGRTSSLGSNELRQRIQATVGQNLEKLAEMYTHHGYKGAISESLQEALEEINNQYAQNRAVANESKKTSLLEDLFNAGAWVDTATSEEGIYSGIMGALGGVGQKVVMDHIPYGKMSVPKLNGSSIERGPDGQPVHEMVRLSNYQRDIRGMKTEYLNAMDMVSQDLDKQDSTIARIRAEKDPQKHTMEMSNFFNMGGLKSVESGYAGVWKNTYRDVANMSQEEAMQAGFAQDENDTQYKEQAEDAIRRLENVEAVYNKHKGRYQNLDQTYGTDYVGYMTHHELQLQELENAYKSSASELKEMEKQARSTMPHYNAMNKWMGAYNGAMEHLNKTREDLLTLRTDLEKGNLSPESKRIVAEYGAASTGNEINDAIRVFNSKNDYHAKATEAANAVNAAIARGDSNALNIALSEMSRFLPGTSSAMQNTVSAFTEVEENGQVSYQHPIIKRFEHWRKKQAEKDGKKPSDYSFQNFIDSAMSYQEEDLVDMQQRMKTNEELYERLKAAKKEFEYMGSREGYSAFVQARENYEKSFYGEARQASLDSTMEDTRNASRPEPQQPVANPDTDTIDGINARMKAIDIELNKLTGWRRVVYAKRYNALQAEKQGLFNKVNEMRAKPVQPNTAENNTTDTTETLTDKVKVAIADAAARHNSRALEHIKAALPEPLYEALNTAAMHEMAGMGDLVQQVFADFGITDPGAIALISLAVKDTQKNWVASTDPAFRYNSMLSVAPTSVRDLLDSYVSDQITNGNKIFAHGILNGLIQAGDISAQEAGALSALAQEYVESEINKRDVAQAEPEEVVVTDEQAGDPVTETNTDPSAYTGVPVWSGKNTANMKLLTSMDAYVTHFAGAKTQTLHKGNAPTVNYRVRTYIKGDGTVTTEYVAVQQEILEDNLRRLSKLRPGQKLFLMIDKEWNGNRKVDGGSTLIDNKLSMRPLYSPDKYADYVDGDEKIKEEALDNFPIKIVNEQGELVMYYPRAGWGAASLDNSDNYMNLGFDKGDEGDTLAQAALEENRRVRRTLMEAHNSAPDQAWALSTNVVGNNKSAFTSSKPLMNYEWSPSKRVTKLVAVESSKLLPDPNISIGIAINNTTISFGNQQHHVDTKANFQPGAPYAFAKDYDGTNVVIPMSSKPMTKQDVEMGIALVEGYLSGNQKHRQTFQDKLNVDISTPAGFSLVFNQFVSQALFNRDLTEIFAIHHSTPGMVPDDYISIMGDGRIMMGHTGQMTSPMIIDPKSTKQLPAQALTMLTNILKNRYKPIRFNEQGLVGLNNPNVYVHPKYNQKGDSFTFPAGNTYRTYNDYVKANTTTVHYGVNQVDGKYVYTVNPQVLLSPVSRPWYPGMVYDQAVVAPQTEPVTTETSETEISEEEAADLSRIFGDDPDVSSFSQVNPNKIPDNSVPVTAENLQEMSNLVSSNHNGRSVMEVLDSLRLKGVEYISKDNNPFRRCP